MGDATDRGRPLSNRPRLTKKAVARALWIVWAIVVWNVVFDRVIVVAGREYLKAARQAPESGPYVSMGEWMRPAVTRAYCLASAASALILIVGFSAIQRARDEAEQSRNA